MLTNFPSRDELVKGPIAESASLGTGMSVGVERQLQARVTPPSLPPSLDLTAKYFFLRERKKSLFSRLLLSGFVELTDDLRRSKPSLMLTRISFQSEPPLVDGKTSLSGNPLV